MSLVITGNKTYGQAPIFKGTTDTHKQSQTAITPKTILQAFQQYGHIGIEVPNDFYPYFKLFITHTVKQDKEHNNSRLIDGLNGGDILHNNHWSKYSTDYFRIEYIYNLLHQSLREVSTLLKHPKITFNNNTLNSEHNTIGDMVTNISYSFNVYKDPQIQQLLRGEIDYIGQTSDGFDIHIDSSFLTAVTNAVFANKNLTNSGFSGSLRLYTKKGLIDAYNPLISLNSPAPYFIIMPQENFFISQYKGLRKQYIPTVHSIGLTQQQLQQLHRQNIANSRHTLVSFAHID